MAHFTTANGKLCIERKTSSVLGDTIGDIRTLLEIWHYGSGEHERVLIQTTITKTTPKRTVEVLGHVELEPADVEALIGALKR